MSFVPTCINISSCLFFGRSSRFSIMFPLEPSEKPTTETSVYLNPFLISLAASNHHEPECNFFAVVVVEWFPFFLSADFLGFVSSSFSWSASVIIF